jgi:hypothetical protein
VYARLRPSRVLYVSPIPRRERSKETPCGGGKPLCFGKKKGALFFADFCGMCEAWRRTNQRSVRTSKGNRSKRLRLGVATCQVSNGNRSMRRHVFGRGRCAGWPTADDHVQNDKGPVQCRPCSGLLLDWAGASTADHFASLDGPEVP